MHGDRPTKILTINSGSSSLKFAIFQMGDSESRPLSGKIDGIGLTHCNFHVKHADTGKTIEQSLQAADHEAAIQWLFAWLEKENLERDLHAVGHRVVHGGDRYSRPEFITPELLATLRELVPLAPDHLPQEIKAIEAVSRAHPTLRQVACFDTAFHRTMPRLAQIYPLPRALVDEGILRYGFHGLSYEYIVSALRPEAGDDAANGRLIIAHLGNGASMAAVRDGQSIDTTMGFTPLGGLMMSTRSGDLDPGVLLYLLNEKKFSAERARQLVHLEAGLLGVSGRSADMEELLKRESSDPPAAEAVALFCYLARKHLAALAATLDGLDTLIFTAGIGENSPPIRSRICRGLDFLGILLDENQNEKNAAIISQAKSPVKVRVMKTNEELMIARHTRALLEMIVPGASH